LKIHISDASNVQCLAEENFRKSCSVCEMCVNGRVNKFPRQLINTQKEKNSWTLCFLCAFYHINANSYFLQELLVYFNWAIFRLCPAHQSPRFQPKFNLISIYKLIVCSFRNRSNSFLLAISFAVFELRTSCTTNCYLSNQDDTNP
jgi:hypothetical protein